MIIWENFKRHSKRTWSTMVLHVSINSVVISIIIWLQRMFKFIDWLHHKINEHWRSTSIKEKSALNISDKLECVYEWIYAYLKKYRKNGHFKKCRQFFVNQWMIKSLYATKQFPHNRINQINSLTERLLWKWFKS